MIPPNFGAPDQIAYYRSVGSAYATAIAASGVKRVVHLSSYGAHLEKGTGFIVGSHHTESILNELEDVAITCLRPGYFYTNLYSYVGMVKNAGFFGANYAGDDKLILVHPSDIAVAAAEELTLSTIGKNIRYIASDEHTASEVAQIIGAAIGKPDLKWLTLTNEQMASGLEKAGLPAHVVANLVELGEATHRGVLKEDYELHKPTVLGKIKLEAFAEEFAAAF